MAKYKVLFKNLDGTEEMENEVFNTEREAEAHGVYVICCVKQGAETLYFANPEDYPLDDFEESSFEVIEVEER